jgi:hypothetical protein
MNRRTLLGWSSVIAATTVLLTACGGPASGAGPSAPANAATGAPANAATSAPSATSTATPADPVAAAATGTCGLVTQQEASTALGAAAAPGDSSNGGCVYKGPADATLSAVIVFGNKTEIDQVKASLVGTTGYQDVPGVGDSAFIKSGDGGGQFYCVKGTRVLMLTLSQGSGSIADALMTVGTTACGRL